MAEPMDSELAKMTEQLKNHEAVEYNLNSFEIDKKIGKGQFSEVYRAKCCVDDNIVALKKVQVYFIIETICPLPYIKESLNTKLTHLRLENHLMWPI